jgi:hypothetical protein
MYWFLSFVDGDTSSKFPSLEEAFKGIRKYLENTEHLKRVVGLLVNRETEEILEVSSKFPIVLYTQR